MKRKRTVAPQPEPEKELSEELSEELSDDLSDVESSVSVSTADVSVDVDVVGPRVKTQAHKLRHVEKPLVPDQDQWVDKYAPVDVANVCMNPQKIKQLRTAMQRQLAGEKRLLIVSGPAGTSKSTVVALIAGELLGISGGANDDDAVISFEESTGREDEFEEWLQGVRYRTGSSTRVVVVEELPNVFHRPTLERFRNAVAAWVYDTRRVPPLVVCLTEVDDVDGGALSVETLFPRWLLAHEDVERIRVNKIAPKFLRQSVARVVANESRSGGALVGVDQKAIEKFVDQMLDVGDIRALLSNLQTWSRTAKIIVANDGGKEVANFGQMFRREDGLELFHSLGKIIYGSTKDSSDDQTLDHVLALYSDLLLLESSLFENYPLYNNADFPVDVACAIVRLLGDGDIMRMPEVSIRAVRHTFSNTPRNGSVRRDKVRFPRQFKVASRAHAAAKQVSEYRRYIANMRVLTSDANLVDGFFVPQIYNSFRYKYLTGHHGRYRYRRVGGEFGTTGDDGVRPLMFGDVEDNGDDDQMDQFLWEIRQKQTGENDDSGSENDGELSDPIDDDVDIDSRKYDNTNTTRQLSGALAAMLTDDSEVSDEGAPDDSLLSDSDLDLLVSQGIVRQTPGPGS